MLLARLSRYITPKLPISLSSSVTGCCHSTVAQQRNEILPIVINKKEYLRDEWSNVTPHILDRIGRNLHLQQFHPLNLVRQKIVDYFYKRFVNSQGNPQFSIHDRLCPVVTTEQNFDVLLTPTDHVSRNKSDCFYVNSKNVLRGHTTAHQADLIRMGLNNFLVIGDVYRRDAIDRGHFPVFHQVDGVRLRTKYDVYGDNLGVIFENSSRTQKKQSIHVIEVVECMELELKSCLSGLAHELLGKDIQIRWVETTFPFTHPSWEMEIFWNNDWVEILGSGIMEHQILEANGAMDCIGWAFGMGLERLTMMRYSIPDIRLFWSVDSGFSKQFYGLSPDDRKTFRSVSTHPQCPNDISFWLPDENFSSNDFYDLVRGIGGDLVEQVELVDDFFHPKKQQRSHCYRIVYRHMERVLMQEEVNDIHQQIEKAATEQLNVIIR